MTEYGWTDTMQNLAERIRIGSLNEISDRLVVLSS